jgi:hypothetical protein
LREEPERLGRTEAGAHRFGVDPVA